MKLETSDRPDLGMLTAVIACSPIVVTECAFARSLALLPAGFEKVDVAILRWIAADSRRSSRGHHKN